QVERAACTERRSVARESGWQHAIEHVGSARDHLQQLRRRAQSHGVTRLVFRQERLTRLDRPNHFFLRLTAADAANRVTIKIKIDNRLRTFLEQLLKGC